MKKLLVSSALAMSIICGSVFALSSDIVETTVPKIEQDSTVIIAKQTPEERTTIGTLHPASEPKLVEPAPIVENSEVLPVYLNESEIFMKYGMLSHPRMWSMAQRIREKYPERFTADKYEESISYISSLFDCEKDNCEASYVIAPVEANFHW